ncbi:MAG TPA: serine/threonine-protein kinase, partial [Polyangiaceae bacterium]
MAEVFLARKPGAEGTYKLLVIKRILHVANAGGGQQASRRLRSMFVEEAQLATRLNHPNVVQVFDFFDGGADPESGGLLLSMEFVEGPDLGMLISSAKAKSTRIPAWIGAWTISEAAKGLHYAHEKKDDAGAPLEIVHRDVSPQNILLSYEGAVKIADFGIATAKLFTDEQGVIKGKFGYMSPEQARGEKVDRRSDVYALGVILWEILTGRPLHGGLGGEALLDIVRSGFVEPPTTYARDIPAELEQIAMKALEARKEERFATARELSNAIARALMAKQELVDALALETIITQLVVRSPGSEQKEPEPDRKITPHPEAPLTSDKPESNVDTGPAPSDLESEEAGHRRAQGPQREVRHVAVVTLRLHGIERLKEQDGQVPAERGLAARTLDR